MEKKELNFNLPLLSVRKSTSTLGTSDGLNKAMLAKPKSGPCRQQSLPIHNKSDWDIDDVTKPAAVPFLWERIPGRPKIEAGARTRTQNPQRSSSPKLPPGRVVSDVVKRNSGERSTELKSYKSQFEVYPIQDHAALVESLRESLYANGESDSENLDDVYSDALDSLSLAESLSLNCSLSGLSGFEVPNMKSSGTFCVDPQTKDLMMSRFLPAAKSVVLQTPQYNPRKQPVVAEQPRQAKKIATDERKPVLDQCNSNLMLSHYQYTQDTKSEDEDDGHDDDDHGKRSRKAWGFFPLLCVKKSLCLLNPVPAMKTRIEAPKSPATDIRRLTRKAYSGPLDKPSCDSSKKKMFHSGVLSREVQHTESKLREPTKFSCSRASYKAEGLSPCRPSRSAGISPCRNTAPQSPFTNGTRFLGPPKIVKNSTNQKYSLSNKNCSNAIDAPLPCVYKQETVSTSDAVEKTLYIDSVKSVNPILNSTPAEATKPANSTNENLENLAESRSKEETSPDDSCIHEVRFRKEGIKVDPKSAISDNKFPSSACISTFRGMADKKEGTKLHQGISREARSFPVDNESEAQTNFTAAIVQSPLPPPLPKSPSESWLWHTMPSTQLRNPLPHSHPANHFQLKKLGQKASSTHTKWETIVKTSNLNHGHGRYSEEIIPHISHRLKKT